MTLPNGLRCASGAIAAPPYTAGPYTWTLQTALADAKMLNYVFTNSATSGDNRGLYLRFYLTGAGSGGEAARLFTTVDDALCGTAHGAHISLNFDSTSGSAALSGLGVAMRATLHIPNDASWTSGTLAAVQAEIYSDGSASDPDGVTELSFIRVTNSGDSTGKADVDTDAFLFSIQGMTAGTGKLLEEGTSHGSVSATLKVKIGTTTKYIGIYDSPG